MGAAFFIYRRNSIFKLFKVISAPEHTSRRTNTPTHVYSIHTYTHIYTHAHTPIGVYTCAGARVHASARTHTHINTSIPTHLHIHVWAYILMHACAASCSSIQTHARKLLQACSNNVRSVYIHGTANDSERVYTQSIDSQPGIHAGVTDK